MELLSVGIDASLKKWNGSSGQLLAAARSTLPSCHFCVVDHATDVIAVGGVAPAIDIYTIPGVVSFSLVAENESSSSFAMSMTISSNTPLDDLHMIFTMLRCDHCFVCDHGALEGVVTTKGLLRSGKFCAAA
ncbi:hypothetical protein ON010_g4013 [Phytophthora cinnamomi]|nr:hypothetical protein ON010_g4013 [Phytophthora cinnamomi]